MIQCGVAALGKDDAITGELRLALNHLDGSASVIYTWTEYQPHRVLS